MNKVKCNICKHYYKIISNTHLKQIHNMTISEYKLKYPNTILMCNNTLEKHNKLFKSEKFKKETGERLKLRWLEDYDSCLKSSLKNRQKSIEAQKVKRYRINCEQCGKKFYRTLARLIKNEHQYCSIKCSSNSDHKKNIAKKNLPRVQNNTKCYHLRSKAGYRNDITHFVRSTWEANMCRLFNQYHIKYKYEFKEFTLSTGEIYVPDFYLPKYKLWLETKGYMHPKWIKKFSLFLKEYPKINITVIDEKNYYDILDNVIIVNKEE